ncbi:MAG: (d)CMP kinase [Candidatus Caenarcaniphilales bacterium]|nr:(d)CMP kinase [Candidatus Caenarcaniphilales bacterium]
MSSENMPTTIITKPISKIVIAIDGPAGAGKSTVARIIAEKLGITYIDTGAMYRAITWLAIANNLNPESDRVQLVELTKESDLQLLPAERISATSQEKFQRVILNGKEITKEIRTPEITSLVSAVSAIGEVRHKLVAIQKEMGQNGGVIMDGRDIGSTVFPNADLKIFLVASSRQRALRRQKQLIQLGNKEAEATEFLEKIQKEIEHRDHLDSTREVSPLKQASDAVLIETDNLKIEEVVEKIILLARNAIR